MLNWGNQFNICCFLDNHQYNSSHHSIECLLAAGSLHDYFSFPNTENTDWLFGHITYDLKNEIEELHSDNPDGIRFPGLLFFQPQYVIKLSSSELSIGSFHDDHEEIATYLPLAGVADKRPVLECHPRATEPGQFHPRTVSRSGNHKSRLHRNSRRPRSHHQSCTS